MRYGELVKRIRRALKALNRDHVESNTLNRDIIEEDQLIAYELDQLLSAFENKAEVVDDEAIVHGDTTQNESTIGHNDDIIDDESKLEPFYQYLAFRYQRIALTSFSYQASPNTWANQACTLLANHIMTAANQIHYQQRNINDILMPAITWRMNGLAEVFLESVNKALKSPIWHGDMFVTLESYDALLNLKNMLLQFEQDQRDVNPENVKPILAYFEKRSKRIEDTDADYICNQASPANTIFHGLAKAIYLILQAGRHNVHGLSPDRLLRPVIHSHSGAADDRLKNAIFMKLKEESLREGNEAKPLTQLLKSIPIQEADLAKAILSEIKDAASDDLSALPLPVYLESQEALNDLATICMQFQESSKPMSRGMQSALIDFLGIRWKKINGTQASYTSTLSTTANEVCQSVADLLTITSYYLDHLNRQRSHLLMRGDQLLKTPEEGLRQLQQVIAKTVMSREHLLKQLTSLPANQWDTYLSYFDLSQLIMLLTNGQTHKGALMELKESYHASEAENKAFLYVIFTAYERCREAQPTYTTYMGLISSHVVAIPSRDQKLAAVDAIKNLLVSPFSLTEIERAVTNEDSAFYKKHHQSFNDGSLKYFVGQIKFAAEAQLNSQSDELQLASGISAKM